MLELATLPPKPPHGFLERAELSLKRYRLADLPVMEVSAPHGFGKTCLMAQWYREAITTGDNAAWISIDTNMDTARMIQALTRAAMRMGERGFFNQAFADWIGSCHNHQQALTGWLAEVAYAPKEMLLLLDDVDQMPAATRTEALDYLLANAPANLRIAMSTSPQGTAASPLLSSTPMLRLTARELRFREAEIFQIARATLADRFDEALAVRIAELTDGWPLGVRLAIASQLRAAPDEATQAAAPDIGKWFQDNVLALQTPATLDLLVTLARIDPVHRELCRDLVGLEAPIEELDRLADETPLIDQSAGSPWLRLHPAARRLLQQMQAEWPEQRQRSVAQKASEWYEAHSMFEEAAHQARLAGMDDTAIRLAERSLRQMTETGRNTEVLEWFNRMSQAELVHRPGFWAPTAWTLAMTDHPDEARWLIDMILARPGISNTERFEAHLIQSTIAAFQEDDIAIEEGSGTWPAPPPGTGSEETLIHASGKANWALLNGETELARHWLTRSVNGAAAPMPSGFAEVLIGLSYLWEGKPQLAYEGLKRALAHAEERMDRGNRVVCMLAATLAQASLETGRAEEARLHLALRIPTVEKQGLPITVNAAHCTMAELRDMEGRTDLAEDHLATLYAIGRARGIARMTATALASQVHLLVRHGRMHSAAHALSRLDRVLSDCRESALPSTIAFVELQVALARSAAFSHNQEAESLRQAVVAAEQAMDIAARLNRGQDLLHARFLLALSRERQGETAAERTVSDLAEQCRSAGLHRLASLYCDTGTAPPDHAGDPGHRQRDDLGAAARARNILTARELDVLHRLIDHMSNKEIALSMGVGEETVKWHVKNLFQKLDAANRKAVVVRARTLGII